MPVERYFKEQDFKIGETIMIADEEYHHIIKVMRGKIGDQIELINGKGLLAYAYITNIGKKTVCCDIHELSKAYFPPPSVILIQAIPRFNRLEYILEKGTELGVTNFWLFPSERSERNTFSENQKQRMEHLIIAATKQCGRLDKPSLSIKKNLMDCLPLQGSVIFG
ncbi:MAG: RsmE family RNA methyltransferase, partial [Rhabdochlamydiaceae bacterium]